MLSGVALTLLDCGEVALLPDLVDDLLCALQELDAGLARG